MIKPADDRSYADVFASIYNSAITLFPEEERCDGDGTIFQRQLQEDRNYVYTEGGRICGFASYHEYEGYFELTSLYVKRECQRMGIGRRLLEYVEGQIGEGALILVKALNNAAWSFDFYGKQGYRLLDEKMREGIKGWGLTEKSREKILYKKR